jgi:hypothetical protein
VKSAAATAAASVVDVAASAVDAAASAAIVVLVVRLAGNRIFPVQPPRKNEDAV